MSASLWQRIIKTTQQALETGALQPISTQLQITPDKEIPFCVRVIDSLVRKESARKSQELEVSKRPTNPFLPYEEALWVTHLSGTHACLLNKFNVVEHHILIVTRHYESQDTWLTERDFEALARCLIEVNGLGFYNSGRQAGASQHHKHLQLIPFANLQEPLPPISVLIESQQDLISSSGSLNTLPFRHSIRLLPPVWQEADEASLAMGLLQTYQQLIIDIGLTLDAPKPDLPYNLLVTRGWMMAVPRSHESYQGIGVNSLGYAGWLLTKTWEDLERLKQMGPLNLLTYVGVPK